LAFFSFDTIRIEDIEALGIPELQMAGPQDHETLRIYYERSKEATEMLKGSGNKPTDDDLGIMNAMRMYRGQFSRKLQSADAMLMIRQLPIEGGRILLKAIQIINTINGEAGIGWMHGSISLNLFKALKSFDLTPKDLFRLADEPRTLSNPKWNKLLQAAAQKVQQSTAPTAASASD
jgi:hypothetical protein